MTADPYMDAIKAGADALAKPYRDPDTISAFVETFPTIAAARVIDAALPHLRDAIIADAIPPGPCGATQKVPPPSPNGPQSLYALCDLRAGHAGQHESEDTTYGYFRWTIDLGEVRPVDYTEQWPELANRCAVEHGSRPGVVCWKQPGHADAHDNGAHMWNDYGEEVQRGV